MSNETNATNAFIATLTGGGLVAAVNEYATFISICIAGIGLVIGLFFHILAVIHRNRKYAEEVEEHKRRFNDIAKQTDIGIKKILEEIQREKEP